MPKPRNRSRSRLREALLRAIYDAVPDMIFVHGPDGRAEDVNENVERIYGWSREEFREVDPAEASGAGVDSSEVFERVRRAREGTPQDFEWVARRKDGSTFPVEVRLRRLEGPEAEGRVLALVRDLSEEKRRQAELRAQERLAALGQFAAGIAHDFNNLLTPMVLYPEMLADLPGVPERVRNALRVIGEQARRGQVLVRQLLDFGRGTPREKTVVNLPEHLGAFSEMVRRLLPGRIALEFRSAPGEHRVWADPMGLEQAVLNLAANARDAMPEGGTLTLAVDRVGPGNLPAEPGAPDEGEWCRITVADTGEGIPADVLPRIFEPFFTTRAPGEGTGLGLSQVHGLVAEHGGHITVESEPGRGTTFRVYLPCRGTEAGGHKTGETG
ncbi:MULTISPECIES: two-component system sensor histidine kinase NtrB [Deferrisoma]